jgi:ELWxxDGT repeat protein
MVGIGKQLFFTARSNEEQGYELFSTDGTEAGTKLFYDFAPEIYMSSFPSVVKGNDSFFLINSTTKAWKSNGTIKNTKELYKNPNDSLGYTYVDEAIPYKDAYLISLFDNENGTELYLCDNQFEHLKILKDINPGVSSSSGGQFNQFGGKIYFLAFNNMLGSDIWVTDGTYDNTLVYLELIQGLGNELLFSWKNRLFFVGSMNPLVGSELYEVIFNATGIHSHTMSSFDIYPNPAKSGNNIHLNTPDDADVCLYNNCGQMVYQTRCNMGTIQFPNLAPGVYTIVASTPETIKRSLLVIE